MLTALCLVSVVSCELFVVTVFLTCKFLFANFCFQIVVCKNVMCELLICKRVTGKLLVAKCSLLTAKWFHGFTFFCRRHLPAGEPAVPVPRHGTRLRRRCSLGRVLLLPLSPNSQPQRDQRINGVGSGAARLGSNGPKSRLHQVRTFVCKSKKIFRHLTELWGRGVRRNSYFLQAAWDTSIACTIVLPGIKDTMIGDSSTDRPLR